MSHGHQILVVFRQERSKKRLIHVKRAGQGRGPGCINVTELIGAVNLPEPVDGEHKINARFRADEPDLRGLSEPVYSLCKLRAETMEVGLHEPAIQLPMEAGYINNYGTNEPAFIGRLSKMEL